MNNIPCEVVRDLFPSYVEKLTSDKTNGYVEEHLEGCADCREALRRLTGDELKELSPEERAEVDFLKKQKKRTRRIVLLSVLGVVVLAFAALGVKLFLIGQTLVPAMTAGDLRVDGTQLELTVHTLGSGNAIRSLEASEKDGVVTVTGREVLVGLYRSGSATKTFTFDEPIREVRIGGTIVWADGEPISRLASELYLLRNPYVGDMSANARLAGMMDLYGNLGPYDNVLSTEAEPYGWTFRLLTGERSGSERLAFLESAMRDYGCLLLATVKNLDWVRYEYAVDKRVTELTVTTQDADRLFGKSVKDCYDNVRLLEELVRKTGADRRVYTELPEDGLGIQMIVKVPDAISGVEIAVYRGERLLTTQGAENADGSPFHEGDGVYFELTERELGGFDYMEELTIRVTLRLSDGTSRELEQPLTFPDGMRTIANLYLVQDESGEYVIE